MPHFHRTACAQRRRVTLLCRHIDVGPRPEATRIALALAVAVANRMCADLRLIALQEPIEPHALNALLRDLRLGVRGECILCGPGPSRPGWELDRLDGELMLAASSRVAADALVEWPAADLVCLLHPEDAELRDIVPGQAGIAAMLQHAELRFMVESEAFEQHLIGRGFAGLAQQAICIDAGRARHASQRAASAEERRVFLFEVMPPVDRERFALGLTVIEQALTLDILDPARWEIMFAAPGLPQVTLVSGQRPTALEHLDALSAWQARQRADLTLRLAASGAAHESRDQAPRPGAVVVLAGPNTAVGVPVAATPTVIVCQPEADTMLQALRRAVQRLRDAAPPRPAAAEGESRVELSLEPVAERLSTGR